MSFVHVPGARPSPHRVEQMDILRGLAIFGVVAIHVSAETLTEKITLSGVFLDQAFRFAVPAFIFLSGLGLSISRRPYTGYLQFVWRRVRKLLLPYCVWTFIYLLFPLYFSGETITLGKYVQAVVTGSASYQLYFVPLIIQFYLLYPFLIKYLDRFGGVVAALILTIAAQLTWGYFAANSWPYLGSEINIFNWLFFFILGIWSAAGIFTLEGRLGQARPFITAALALCLAGLIIEAYTNLASGKGLENSLTQVRPAVILYSLVFGIWCWLFKAWPGLVGSFLLFLSRISYEIYLAHVFVLVLFDHFFYRYAGISKASLIYGVTAFVTVFSVSILIVLAWRYLGKKSRSVLGRA